MAFFNVNPSDATGVVLAAASTGERARFLFIQFTNMTTTALTVQLRDGGDASATARLYVSLPSMTTVKYDQNIGTIASVFPKTWWTAGNAIWVDCSSSNSVRVTGEIVREP